MNRSRPLDGIRVVSLEHAVAVPFATRQLADLGAEVIKIERPGAGDFARAYDKSVNGLASYFVWLNRGKKSVTLDVKQPVANEVLQKLIARADVVVQNLAPGAAARLGVSYEALAPKHPRLIVCDLSGYGETGPLRDKKAYDLLIQAESGLIATTGSADTPSRAGASIADIAAGMYAYSGILTALLQRERTDRGARVEISMLEALSEWMMQPVYLGHYGGKAPSRQGATHPIIAPYGPHRAGDGTEVIFGLQNEREWQAFCNKVLVRPELASDERFDSNTKRVAARAELTALIETEFEGLSAEQVVARLDAAGIANGRLNDMNAVWNHEQLRARGRWAQVQTEQGAIEALLPPVNISGVEPVMGDVPALGQHTEAVLAELGYDGAAIARMRESKAI
ncbi:CaiB/BaiF CoA transferase family protein [Aromatoleum petrolei]|uniref:CoA transferase n=1 Tax=Aromatoleum petrolei TaxID=76116 RepID=A0ABX1MQG4_9RHOO|nr:CaiB/BaiF CoA-transferase family protein [Aromatoleum petrolei]NMF88571.1 CoA transferase [Aromatoleum petrolei]QTQ34721.1 CoA-transferase family III protein [Aromatoleum petrolei]